MFFLAMCVGAKAISMFCWQNDLNTKTEKHWNKYANNNNAGMNYRTCFGPRSESYFCRFLDMYFEIHFGMTHETNRRMRYKI